MTILFDLIADAFFQCLEYICRVIKILNRNTENGKFSGHFLTLAHEFSARQILQRHQILVSLHDIVQKNEEVLVWLFVFDDDLRLHVSLPRLARSVLVIKWVIFWVKFFRFHFFESLGLWLFDDFELWLRYNGFLALIGILIVFHLLELSWFILACIVDSIRKLSLVIGCG